MIYIFIIIIFGAEPLGESAMPQQLGVMVMLGRLMVVKEVGLCDTEVE